MRNFSDALVRRIAELENPTVLGLDPKLDSSFEVVIFILHYQDLFIIFIFDNVVYNFSCFIFFNFYNVV